MGPGFAAPTTSGMLWTGHDYYILGIVGGGSVGDIELSFSNYIQEN